MSHYILIGHDPVSTDPATWREWFQSADRVVARTEINPDTLVSIVFVGLDMGCDPDTPLLFETEVMESGTSSVDARRVRYSDLGGAERGHAEVVHEYRHKSSGH